MLRCQVPLLVQDEEYDYHQGFIDQEKNISRLAIVFCHASWSKDERSNDIIEEEKYSPEVLLSGGKPIECLEETKIRYV